MHTPRRLLTFPCLVLLGCAGVPRPPPDFPLADAVSNASSAVRVDVFRHGHGSGVIISTDGLVLTCEHVVRHVGRADVVATVTDGRTWSVPAKVVATDPKRDLALLRTDVRFDRAAELAGSPAFPDERIYGIGFPKSSLHAISRGIVKRYPFSVDMRPAEPANFKEGVLAEMPAEGGASGQGVFSADTGRLIGLHKLSFEAEDGPRSVLISAEEIRAFLSENDIQIK